MVKLVDVKCEACGQVVKDVLLDPPNEVGQTAEVDGPPACQANPERSCGPFKVVLSVPRHSKHSSWAVR